MALVINTNVASLNAQRNLLKSSTAASTAMQRLSSGLRINSARDDAAGLAIATRMEAQARGMVVAQRNASDAISLAQTADSGLAQLNDYAMRMRELSVQAANASNTAVDRAALNTEFQALASEMTRVIGATKFNGNAVLAGANTNTFQIGASAGESITITGTDLSADATITAVTGGDLTSVANATTAMTDLDAAMATINTQRAVYGAAQSRFEGAIQFLQAQHENTMAARSRIMDADFATETAALTRAQVLQQAGTAMLAQANGMPQSILNLLR